MGDTKSQLTEDKKRKAKKPKKKKPKPLTLEEVSARVDRIENHQRSTTTRNAEFALTSLRELSVKMNEMVQQINIMGEFLKETEQIDACNEWWENKIAEQQKEQEDAMEKAKAEQIKRLKDAAKAMKEAEHETNDNPKELAPDDKGGKAAQGGNKGARGAVQKGITDAEKADGGHIKRKD